jgi:hypothetical protein
MPSIKPHNSCTLLPMSIEIELSTSRDILKAPYPLVFIFIPIPPLSFIYTLFLIGPAALMIDAQHQGFMCFLDPTYSLGDVRNKQQF